MLYNNTKLQCIIVIVYYLVHCNVQNVSNTIDHYVC